MSLTMNKKLEHPLWNGKPILHPDHAHDLEFRSAILEFGHKLPRATAEEYAHQEYKKNHHIQAAAHHLRGMKAAQGSGDSEEAHKHGLMYSEHMKSAGLDPMGPVPKEIQEHEQNNNRHYKFKAHRADLFVLKDHES